MNNFLRPRSLRLATLSALSAALLAACGGGNDSGGGGSSQQPSACPAVASTVGNTKLAATAAQSPRLIAKLKAGAQLPAQLEGAARKQARSAGAQWVPGLRMLKLSELSAGSAAKSATSGVPGGSTGSAPRMRFMSLEVTEPGLSVNSAMQRIQDTGLVEYVELDANMRKSLLPNDAQYFRAWHLKNTGQYAGSAPNFDIAAESAWNRGVGTGSTVVAVIDDGANASHPDLAPNMWRNSGEIPGNCIDDDNNNLVDDVHGADMVLGIGDVSPYFPRIDSDHGTMVSGVIAAKGNNSEGVTGVNWNTKIMALKIEGPESSGYSLLVSDFVDAFNYILTQKARGVNVRVINVSYGTDANVQAYRDVIVAAGQQGILVVAPMGNDGTNDPALIGYPSRWVLPNVISVGASAPNATRASFSNFGPLANIYAPGEAIVTTSMFASAPVNVGLVAPGYRVIDGTSFAAPIVAGAAALLMDTYPSASMSAVRARLLNTASPFGSGQVHLNLGAAMAASP